MWRSGVIAFGLTVAALAQSGPISPGAVLDEQLTVPWRDDAVGHPDLIRFRETLMRAAKRHDLNAILATADPDDQSVCTLDAMPGEAPKVTAADTLRAYFAQSGPGFDPWSSFYDSLASGGVLEADGKSFSSNYAMWTFPSEKTGTLGAEYFNVINGANVPVYERPSSTSRILAHLSHNVVILTDAKVDSGWQQIEFRRGTRGFVLSKNLISPVDATARLTLRHGRWKLTGISGYCE